uniref:Uncharacterized protein n=1 Tax=Romanomermis culicivorax TaxID=13658 RepID=A0A915JE87_ROMCU
MRRSNESKYDTEKANNEMSSDLVSACEIIDFRSPPHHTILEKMPPGIAFGRELMENSTLSASNSADQSPIHRSSLVLQENKQKIINNRTKATDSKALSSKLIYEQGSISSKMQIGSSNNSDYQQNNISKEKSTRSEH